MLKTKPKYIIDDKGTKKEVIISYKDYEYIIDILNKYDLTMDQEEKELLIEAREEYKQGKTKVL